MAYTIPSKKRRITESDSDEDYDSEEIVVASPQRQPLRNLIPTQAQNKRRRVLDCVLIPPYKRNCGKSALYNASPSQQLHTKSSSAPSADVVTSRPRRAVKRPSYAPPLVDDLSSEDESATTITKPARSMSIRQDTSFEASESVDEFVTADSGSEASEDRSASVGNQSASSLGVSSDVDELPVKKVVKSAASQSKAGSSRAKASQPAKTKHQIDAKGMTNLIDPRTKFGFNLRPLSQSEEIFEYIARSAMKLGFKSAIDYLKECRPLRVATMCSGTESPLIALQMIREALKTHFGLEFRFEHVFSVEITPFKQAYIERNLNPDLIFRDIAELIEAVKDNHKTPMATTAYGGKVAVPTDIDIVIAGTSCKDFSGLNRFKKGLKDDGESGVTWRGVHAFCDAYKPSMVLFENIKNAPWDEMRLDYEQSGYAVAGAYVDTKNFYLPQTRQRGYMMCFNASRLKKANITRACEEWKSNLESFKRPASSPVSSFLLPADSVISRDQARFDEVRQEHEWAKCAEIHVRYRYDKGLGTARPFTNWLESGSLMRHERGPASWYAGLPEREKDLLDINYLRKAKRDVDTRFKERFWNMTQNVDREEDNIPFGIVPCLTTRSRLFVSDAGRPMAPEEYLILQGLPPEKISFTTETATEIQDLAGNAMSSTVVGCAVLSGVQACYKMFPRSLGRSAVYKKEKPSRVTNVIAGETESLKLLSGDEDVEIGTLLEIVSGAMRRCYCEGSTAVARKPIQRCDDCGHTTCISCGGNPEHNYRHSQSLSQGRMPPQDAEMELKTMLPLVLRFSSVTALRRNAENNERLRHEIIAEYLDYIETATNDTFTLHHRLRRTHCITAVYHSPRGRLELVLNDGLAEWRLYVTPPRDRASSDPLVQALIQPVAKSTIQRSLFDNTWAWRLPTDTTISAYVKGFGKKIPAWRSRIGIPSCHGEWQPEFITITHTDIDGALLRDSVQGKYEYLPRCGTARESLYKRINQPTSAPMFLFFDPSRTGPTEEDTFVFSREQTFLEPDEIRPIVARMPESWQPRIHGHTHSMVTLSTDGEWTILAESGRLQPVHTTLETRKATQLNERTKTVDCHQALELIRCKVTGDLALSSNAENFVSINLNDREFINENAWTFEGLRRVLDVDQWHIYHPSDVNAICGTCAPQKPSLRWKFDADREMLVPEEDVSSANKYERAMKGRSVPVVVDVLQSGNLSSKIAQLRLSINLESMAHRVRARLPQSIENVRYKWRLKTNFSPATNFSFRPFQLPSNKNTVPFNDDLGMKVDLFPNQRRSISWMIQSESGRGQPFVVEEAEEHKLGCIGWTLEMRVEASIYVKGGIRADLPGYGKTILSLGLIQHDYLKKGTSEILEELRARYGNAEGYIPSAASLVVVPRTLVHQWVAEKKSILGDDYDIIAIKTTADLDRISIQRIQDARIVIVSAAVLSSEVYVERLAAFAGIPGPLSSSGRAHRVWRTYATDKVQENMQLLAKSDWETLQGSVARRYRENIADHNFKTLVPSRSSRVGEHVKALERVKKSKAIHTPAPLALDMKKFGRSLFEMFRFNRLICDEFHLLNPVEIAAVVNLRREKTWGLSGTPAMGDSRDIHRMGELLGVHLPVGFNSRRIMKQKNIRELQKELTDSELFDLMRDPAPSESMLAWAHAIDQTFVDAFVRRDVPDFEIPIEEHLIVVTLDLFHQAVYVELSNFLNAGEAHTRKGNRTVTTDREERLYKALETCETAEEALCQATAFIERGISSIESVIQVRKTSKSKTLRDLQSAMSAAIKIDQGRFESWYSGRVIVDVLGDEETMLEVENSCKIAASRSVGKHKGVEGSTSEVNTLVGRLLNENRSLRYMRNLIQIRGSTANRTMPFSCDQIDCHGQSFKGADVAISVHCGHRVCRPCYESIKTKCIAQCQSEQCRAPMSNHDLVWKSKLSEVQNPRDMPFGAKLHAAVRKLKQIEQQGDQAILFIQFECQLDQVRRALEDGGISASVVANRQTAEGHFADFNTGRNGKKTVIVLNASDEMSAGLNLQKANHVIFLGPLLRVQQYTYRSNMAQAIGRVRRYGQKKKVQVYTIIARDTIDIDILEHRERRNAAVTEEGAPRVEPPELWRRTQVHAEPVPERTQFVRDNGRYSLQPQSWLVCCRPESDSKELSGKAMEKTIRQGRVLGWEDFTSLNKWSSIYTEDE